MGLVLGLALAFILGTGLHFGAKIFTQDANVLHLIQIGIPVIVHFQIGKDILVLYLPNSLSKETYIVTFMFILSYQFVAVTQPLNSIAFVFDGVNFGASDFAYSAFSMVSIFFHFLMLHGIMINGIFSLLH